MNQFTRVLLGQFILKSIQKVGFKPQFHHQSIKPQRLTQKLCYFESNMKSRGFKTVEKDIPFAEYIKKSINSFPYCKLPKYNQRFSEQKQLQPSEYERLVAFNSLFVINQANKQRELKEMAQILLKQDFHKFFSRQSMLTGVQVFSMYYERKLGEFVKEINQDGLSAQQVTYYYQVMTNLIPTQEVTEYVERIKQEKVLTMNAHVQALHVKLLIRHNLPYIHALDKLYQQLISSQTSSSATTSRLQAAKTLLSIDDFSSILSEMVKTQCMQIIIANVQNIQAFDHIMIIKHIYMNNSKDCVAYINKVTEEIMSLHLLKKSDELHVPLMLKVIKYRSKLHLDNKMFLDIINSYPDKFNTVFRQKNVNKQIFLSLTTKQSTTQLSPQIRSQFGSYIRKVFQDYNKKEEIDEDELIRNLKLVLKYGNEIKKQELSQVIETMVDGLYERMKHAVSDQLKYYVFLVAYSFNFENSLQKTTIVNDTLETYHQKCLNEPTTQNISRALNIEYQLMRKSPESQARKNIWAYNYGSVELYPSAYSYLLFLMKKDKGQGKIKQKIQTINQLKKNIYKNLSHGNYSMKIIYTLIDVLDDLKYADRYMFMDIERGICKNLQKSLFSGQKKKGVQLPLPKDIVFLKNKLAKNSLCSSKFTEFLDLSEKNYNLIRDYAREYIDKSKNWQKIRQNARRNREGEEKKPQKNNQ